MTRRFPSRASGRRPGAAPARLDLRSRIAAWLMLAAIFGALALGAAMLIFILRDLWVFMATMMQPQ